jgi:hypothetical protein
MNPKGLFRLFSPVMGIVGNRNLRDTADALAVYVEHSTGASPVDQSGRPMRGPGAA